MQDACLLVLEAAAHLGELVGEGVQSRLELVCEVGEGLSEAFFDAAKVISRVIRGERI